MACQLFLPISETQNDLGAAQFFAPVYRESRRAGGGAFEMGRKITEVTRSLSPFFIRSISRRAGGGGSDGATR